MNRTATALRVAAAALLALPLAACGSDNGGGAGSAGSAGTDAPSRTLTVFAAASLTTTFTALEKEFEEAEPGVDVKLSFGGSSDLVAQITEGAPADVFASADTKNMDKLTAADLADGTPVVFATNTLEIAVPPGNPGKVAGLADLARPDLDVVVCAPEVPCGSAAAQVAKASGVTLSPDSEEQSVTDVLAKVEAGEADAGIVYRTDVKAAGSKVEGVAIAGADQVVNSYPIVAVRGAAQASLAKKWIALVTGARGRAVFTEAGFGPPTS